MGLDDHYDENQGRHDYHSLHGRNHEPHDHYHHHRIPNRLHYQQSINLHLNFLYILHISNSQP